MKWAWKMRVCMPTYITEIVVGQHHFWKLKLATTQLVHIAANWASNGFREFELLRAAPRRWRSSQFLCAWHDFRGVRKSPARCRIANSSSSRCFYLKLMLRENSFVSVLSRVLSSLNLAKAWILEINWKVYQVTQKVVSTYAALREQTFAVGFGCLSNNVRINSNK